MLRKTVAHLLVSPSSRAVLRVGWAARCVSSSSSAWRLRALPESLAAEESRSRRIVYRSSNLFPSSAASPSLSSAKTTAQRPKASPQPPVQSAAAPPSWLQLLKERVGVAQRTVDPVQRMYQGIWNQARSSNFFRYNGPIPLNMRTTLDFVFLHLWIIRCRLREVGTAGVQLWSQLQAVLWRDVYRQLSLRGVDEQSIDSVMLELQGVFDSALSMYQLALDRSEPVQEEELNLLLSRHRRYTFEDNDNDNDNDNDVEAAETTTTTTSTTEAEAAAAATATMQQQQQQQQDGQEHDAARGGGTQSLEEFMDSIQDPANVWPTVLWHTVYAQDEKISRAHLTRLSDYVAGEVANIMSISRRQLLMGNITWSAPPS